MFYIDIDSSTIKVYSYKEKLELLEDNPIYFKNGFTKDRGITSDNLSELYSYFKLIKTEYGLDFVNTKIYVRGIFRSLLKEQQNEIIAAFNEKFNLCFNIISQGLETYYLEKAMNNDYNNKKVMIINEGEKTTEIVVFKNKEIIDQKKINAGVIEILNRFEKINEEYALVKIEEVYNYALDFLKDVELDDDYDCAIFTGSEERFAKLVKFNLVQNTLFTDGIHEYMLNYQDYVDGCNKIFYQMTMNDLYSLMPQNPKWMEGARAGAILPLAIFTKAKINMIVPSDLNLIHGVINDLNEE